MRLKRDQRWRLGHESSQDEHEVKQGFFRSTDSAQETYKAPAFRISGYESPRAELVKRDSVSFFPLAGPPEKTYERASVCVWAMNPLGRNS
jgi:hypothetical protein